MKRGEIYLADFGKSRNSFEFGKKRPVLIFQTDKLNLAVEAGIYDYFLVIPLSTKQDIVTEEFRYAISSRERLKEESYAVCNSLCFLPRAALKEKIATLTPQECVEVEQILKNLFEISDE
ncbi:type II toxin-antitoxin system PemK/MazF family toxin [Nitratifractor sp.]|uniref:type II toxin-antitoxin system PemK/MazF family toxin n=1 Tax=Nitratifractor sp. TaxID=2268144 RepID=UPI0025FC9AD7|nr:type II toxin-antitoxin system PemK/MazF family toxin [Nitratifractor sp.]